LTSSLMIFVFTLITCLITSLNTKAQINVVSGGNGLAASYTSLTNAGGLFVALNATSQAGQTIVISIVGDVTTEAGTNSLTGAAGMWTSLSITPSGARTISGAVATNLIDFNGADNVTIDGLNSGGNSLTIDNSLVNPIAVTIRFIADAINNTITNCTIKSANRGTTAGTIVFSTGTTTGNDGNIISNNTITSSVGAFTYFAIYSNGTSAAVDNSNITITGNNIQDYFFDGGGTLAAPVDGGIFLNSTGNSQWTITNNKMFQTGTRVYAAGGIHTAIDILVGSNYTINNNVIGFANSSGTGTTNLVGNSVALAGFPASYSPSGSQTATRFVAISCAFTVAGTVSNIQGNTIGGIALYTSSGATTTNGILCGINVTSGNANIGTTSGNIIGATSGQGSFYAACSTTGGTVVGIFATSANTVNIQNNTIGSVDAVATTSSLNGGFTGIDAAGAGVFTITNNNIGNTSTDNIRTGFTTTTGVSGGNLSNAGILTSTSSSTGSMVGIRNASTGATISISSNTLRGWAASSTGIAVTGITNTSSNATSISLNSNLLGTAGLGWMRFAFANSGALTGVSNSSGTATTAISLSSNDFQGITYAVASTGSHTYINCGTGTCASINFNNNTFTNLNVNTTGTITFINEATTISTGAVENMNNNAIVTAFNRGGASGSVIVTTTNASTPAGNVQNFQGNNFSNITLAGTSTFTGYNNTDGGAPTKVVTGNTFNNINVAGAGSITCININFNGNGSSVSNNIITNLTSQSSISGITYGSSGTSTLSTIASNTISNLSSTGAGSSVTAISSSSVATTNNINNNSVSTLSSTAASAVIGITSSATTSNIFKNKICDLSGSNAGSTVNGIALSSATTASIYNNLIGDLRAPAANASNPVIGLNITGGTTVNAHYNTVYLNASSSGALFGSSALSASTTPTLTLRNNIFYNASTTTGTGLAAAYRRSSTTLTSYAAASNNNLFFGSTIFTDGTNTDATLAAYKTRVASRDNLSITENLTSSPTFLSTTCGNANFLHMSSSVSTQTESGGVSIAGVTDDYDGNTRNATTPDIGADEFNGIFTDIAPPAIVYTPLPNTCNVGGQFLTATITDPSGVPTAGVGLPVAYWKINAGPYQSSQATYQGSNNYQFTLGLGAVSGDIVTYYIVAQDNAGTPNVGSSPSAGASGFTANPPAAATPPTTPNSYQHLNYITGTFTVGSGGNYPTLTAAIAAYNNSCLNGAVVFNLIDANYSGSETFPIVINQNLQANINNTLTIKPANPGTVISGSLASDALIKFNGADYVTIDGSTSGGTDQSLTITNTNTTAPTAISLVSLGLGASADGNTIKNCLLSTGVYAGSSYGIAIGGATPGTAGPDNDNNLIQNNTITGATFGIYAVGTTSVSAGAAENLWIFGNNITTNTTVATYGMQLGFTLGTLCSLNTVNVSTTGATAPVGISIETGVNTAQFTRNNITGVNTTNTGGYGGRGITVGTGSATSALLIANNFISGVNGPSWTSFGNSAAMGIALGVIGNTSTLTTTTGGISIQYNSVNMYGNHSAGGFAGAAVTTALYVGSGVTNMFLNNNILVNSQFNPNASGTASKNYAIYSAAANTAFSQINNNDYYVSGTQGVLGFIGSDRTTLAAIVTGFGGNANSVNVAPVFTSTSDLHLVNTSNPLLDGSAQAIAITIDYDNQTRNATTPDIGADEFTPPTCAGAVGGTASGSTSFCGSGTPSITATGYSAGTGSTYQWMSSASAGNYPGSGTPVAGQNNPASLSTGVVSTTTYYWLRVTCTSGLATDYSNMITVTINPAAASILEGAAASICNGSSITLHENGGTGTSWSWAPGGATTQNVTVSPSSTTTYTVTVTSPGSCTATASIIINVNALPTVTSVNASPNPVCSGSQLNLSSTGTAAVTGYSVASTAATAATPAAGSTILCTGGANQVLTGYAARTTTLDDAYWDGIPLPFSFNYYGTPQTSIRVATNGNVQFGTAVAGGQPGSWSWTPQSIPTAGGYLAGGYMGFPWTDLDPTSGGTIRYFTNGTAPNRVFVISFESVFVYNSTDLNTAQVKLYEGTNIIDIFLG
jgi:hypothetical protein